MTYLYYCPQMAPLAERIRAVHRDIVLGEIQWEAFDDGFPNLRVSDVHSARNQNVVFLASLDSPEEIFRQLAVIYEIPRYVVRSFKLILPYFPVGTMERVDVEGEIATAATLARMLSKIPHSVGGPTQIVVYDIHAPQERFYFSDTVVPRLETAVPLLHRRLRNVENVAVAFPDEGAVKRFGKSFQDYETIICQKVRRGKERIVSIKEGDPSGKHVIIVDDLVMSGGTLRQCARALGDSGADRVSAYITHGVFPKDSWKTFLDAGFAHIWLTDSCPQTASVLEGRKPFEILSLADPVSKMLDG